MVNTKTFLVESIPCWYETIGSACGKCLVLNSHRIYGTLQKKSDRPTFWWNAIALTGYISSLPSCFCLWHLKAYLNSKNIMIGVLRKFMVWGIFRVKTVSLKTNRFFWTSAVGSKYSTETRPSIDEITNPIPFGKHLIARVWYLRFDSRFCWHTSRKYSFIGGGH